MRTNPADRALARLGAEIQRLKEREQQLLAELEQARIEIAAVRSGQEPAADSIEKRDANR
jgi:predicted  nucleic acid-binding Zn-ribbon protein